VSDFEERTVGALRVRIDRTLCVGFGDCITEAPEAFVLDDTGTAVFVKPDTVDRERLLRACDACPVDAITVWNEHGVQIVPPPVACEQVP
jgi:ferredoxin